jgi:FMN phosphatase YigB (HAD superfamily)
VPLRTIFLDVDGVILDPERARGEWTRLSGDIYAAELGGDAAAWGLAGVELFPLVWEQFMAVPIEAADWDRVLDLELMRRLCEHFGIAVPDDERSAQIGRRKDVYVAERMRAAFPGAATAIRELGRRFALHTASGNSSYRIDALLRGMGLRDLFGLTVGPELIGIRKYRPKFYEAMISLAGVAPADALFVDDQRGALMDAARLGAATILVDATSGVKTDPSFDAGISSLAELPALLDRGFAHG